jgi:hypothetical protein
MTMLKATFQCEKSLVRRNVAPDQAPRLPRRPTSAFYNSLFGDKPDKGAYQYADPLIMTAILRLGLEWQAIDRRPFGVGNISLPGGRQHKDHRSNVNGLQVDVRPLR